MAPVTATATGIARQTIDDPKLVSLIENLSSFHTPIPSNADRSVSLSSSRVSIEQSPSIVDVDGIVTVLEKYPTWRFQEQADLYEWIRPLNAMDAALDQLLQANPSLLLIQRETKNSPTDTTQPPSPLSSQITPRASHSVITILRFLVCLLRNATSKPVFNSVDILVDLLAAGDDTIASLALETLSNLAAPPLLHRQQAPELNQHTTALHTAKATAHTRIMALARGWGSRGSGLGLYTCVTTDDSSQGQGNLPRQAGEVTYQFFDISNKLITVHLSGKDILDSRYPPPHVRTRSTTELFNLAISQTNGLKTIPREKLFPLLSHIRLAASFHSQSLRSSAVERRLRALICVLHAHPSQDIMAGYFHAQPELCVEMVDLVRPTVSSGGMGVNAMRAVAESAAVPYSVRTLAVEALTALVARRDGTSGGLSQVARQVNVLSELGVGKGQYLGFLPTLIRYSLASLNAFLTQGRMLGKTAETDEEEEDLDLSLGLAFLKATKAPPLPLHLQEERALEFIDAVLTLTSAVVSVPSGTAALTDCGLIPALVSTVALDSHDDSAMESGYSECLMKFITAQAIQILEGAIVTHTSALTAFHDLLGVDILVRRLHEEIERVKKEGTMLFHKIDDSMDVDNVTAPRKHSQPRPLRAARRVLLFSIVNCLTVVFHQQETPTASAPSGAAQLRKPELTAALTDILENVDSYGGVLAALTATLLSDVMNGDPQIVHHVHSSGLANSFLKMLMGENHSNKNDDSLDEWRTPTLPAASELIMALPNVISALSLTEEGAKVIREVNPFPSLLSLFYSPQYAMPRSRCLLNEMTAIVGTGLDELMRHVPSLRPLGTKALVMAIRRVKTLGVRLLKEEESFGLSTPSRALENSRTCLMQYAYNMSQLLEQVLHNEEHACPFVDAGGLDAVLELHPLLMPTNSQFLTHVSCLSSPAVANLTHSMTTSGITMTIKSIASHYDSHKLIRTVANVLDKQLLLLKGARDALEPLCKNHPPGLLSFLPIRPLHTLDSSYDVMIPLLSKYLRHIVTTEWLINILAAVIRAACQRSHEMGQTWGGSERDQWKKEICSEGFANVLRHLSLLYRESVLEVCRIRSDGSFDERDSGRRHRVANSPYFPACYRLRIVCQEGAVVRDGIEIDSCESVGGLEMGEIVEAFDRCINSSGVMRYRTPRGWVSEQTRGHGREPIAEVLSIRGAAPLLGENCVGKNSRVECGIADLAAASASVLARLHYCHKNLFSCLSRAVSQGVRSLNLRPQSMVGGHVGAVIGILEGNLKRIFGVVLESADEEDKEMVKTHLSTGGLAMYLGSGLELLHSCLYEEKRERKILNVPLLASIVTSRSFRDGSTIFPPADEPLCSPDEDSLSRPRALPNVGFLNAIRFVLKHSLEDMSSFQSQVVKPCQRLSRSVSSSFPPTLTLLRRLSIRSLIVDSQMGSILGRMKSTDLANLFGENACEACEIGESTTFHPSKFARTLHVIIGNICLEFYKNPLLPDAPAHIIHPVVSLISEILSSLEEASKPLTLPDDSTSRSNSTSSPPRHAEDMQERVSRSIPIMSVLFGASRSPHNRSGGSGGGGSGSGSGGASGTRHFEPSEQTVERLTEMGFSREHALEALESTENNRLEVAMEYALAHPPPSPTTVERRRAAREERRQQREQMLANAMSVPFPDERTADHNANQEGNNESSTNATTQQDSAMSVDETDSKNLPNNNTSNSTTANNDQQPLTDAEKKAQRKKEIERQMTARVKCCLNSFRKVLLPVSLSLISSPTAGTGESEALTFVTTLFLLELCGRYPNDRSQIVGEMLSQFKSHIVITNEKRSVIKKEREFAGVAHACVIMLRSLPRTRGLVLRRGIVTTCLNCLRHFLSDKNSSTVGDTSDDNDNKNWPRWLSPVLLLLDVMAQPTAAPVEEEVDEERCEGQLLLEGEGGGLILRRGEFVRLCNERKKYAALLSKTARDIVATVNGRMSVSGSGGKKGKKNGAKKKEEKKEGVSNSTNPSSPTHDGANTTTSNDVKPLSTAFPSIPLYTPLLPHEESEMAMALCLRLLRHKPSSTTPVPIPSSVAHATLLLLARTLRNHKLASQCLRMGGAELILSLPPPSRFLGHTGLVTVILRHMLEDEGTLRTVMESEIRGTVARLHKTAGRKEGDSRVISVTAKAFVGAVTPLICRDPVIFLKAAATSVKVDGGDGSSCSSGASTNSVKIVLLTTEERSKNVRALQDVFGPPSLHHHTPPSSLNRSLSDPGRNKSLKSSGNNSIKDNIVNSPPLKRCRSSTTHHHNTSRGQSPHSSSNSTHKSPKSGGNNSNTPTKRGVSPKRSRKEKHSSSSSASPGFILLNGTPANHITSLLLSQLISTTSGTPPPSSGTATFLRTVDYLDLLADLVLVLPACAAAIHRYKLPSPLLKSHNTAVGYVLHTLLPQKRNVTVVATDTDSKKNRMTVKLAQSAARLLIALCARAGEGRRRVVSELAASLSSSPSSPSSEEEVQMWSLQSWAELTIGLAAPRSSNINQDSNSALSFEVVKLLLEYGVGHALMKGLGRVSSSLAHPMAANVAGAILRPLEVFTRASVIDAVEEMVRVEKEDREKETKKEGTSGGGGDKKNGGKKSMSTASNAPTSSGNTSRRITLGPSQRNERDFADDAMLEDGFDPETADRARRSARRRDFREMVEGMVHLGDYDDLEDSDASDEDDEDDETEDMDEDEQAMDFVEGHHLNDEEMEEDGSQQTQVAMLAHQRHHEESDDDGSDDEESRSSSSRDDDSMVNDSENEVDSHDEMDGSDDEEGSDDSDEDDEDTSDDEDDPLDAEGDFSWGDDAHDNGGFFEGHSSSTNHNNNQSSNNDEVEETLTLPSDADLEEGWTRIESSSGGNALGGVFLGTRQNGLGGVVGDVVNRHVNRPRGFVIDAAEAMIGNILRGSAIQMEALAEIEDTLGIRFMHHPRGGGRASGSGASGSGGNGGGSGSGGDFETRGGGWNPTVSLFGDRGGGDRHTSQNSNSNEALNPRNRGAIGSLPIISQSHPTDTILSAGSGYGNRSHDMTYMEYAFGTQASDTNIESNNGTSESDYDYFALPTNITTELFPGGPAAAAHARTQQRLHPLLIGVELPPVNSLFSTVQPHTMRHLASNRNTSSDASYRRDASGGDINVSGGLNTGFMSSGSSAGANIIRLNRGPNGAPILEHHWSRGSGGGSGSGGGGGNMGAELRWTDDGQPLDSTTGDFSVAFERVLGETIARDNAGGAAVVSDGNQDPVVESGSGSRNEDTNSPAAAGDNSHVDGAGAAGSQSTEVTPPEPQTDAGARRTAPSRTTDVAQSTADTSTTNTTTDNQNTSDDVPPALSTSTAQTTTDDAPVPMDIGDDVPAPDPASSRTDAAGSNAEGNNSEGEGVASSLAAGLTLSPRSDESSSANISIADTALASSHAAPTNSTAAASQDERPPPADTSAISTSPSNNIPTDAAASASDPSPVDLNTTHTPNEYGHTCPPGMDPTVFNSLPEDMQREVLEQHRATLSITSQLDGTSSRLDPEALAALPEDMRREIIEQERQEQLMRERRQGAGSSGEEQGNADPSQAEEMDNASFIASLAPDLREDILLTADESFLNSLPPDIIAEAHILRERASSRHERRVLEGHHDGANAVGSSGGNTTGRGESGTNSRGAGRESSSSSTSRRRHRVGKMRVDVDRANILYIPPFVEEGLGPLVTSRSMKALIRLMYLLSPVRPQRLLQKLIQNLCANKVLRRNFLVTFVSLLNDDSVRALKGVQNLPSSPTVQTVAPVEKDDFAFPPSMLIGTAPEVVETDSFNSSHHSGLFRRRQGGTAAAAIAANLPASARGSHHDEFLPPVVARRIVETLWFLSKNAPRVCLDMLESSDSGKEVFDDGVSCLDRLLDLLSRPLYSKSSTNLEQILNLLESLVSPLSLLPKDDDDADGKIKPDENTTAGKELVSVPRTLVSPTRLKLLCSVLRLESCKDSSFQKVNTIARRLCRVEANRACILRELARVAQGLGSDAIRDLKLLSIRLNDAVELHQDQLKNAAAAAGGGETPQKPLLRGIPGSAVTLSTSSSELKLLRVLQTLHGLCADNALEDGGSKKYDGQMTVTPELVALLKSIDLESLWDELTACLRVVSVLEGVSNETDSDEKDTSDESNTDADQNTDLENVDGNTATTGKKLQNSVAGLLTRFLPTIEAFFVVNASSVGASGTIGASKDSGNKSHSEGRSTITSIDDIPICSMDDAEPKDKTDAELTILVGGNRLVKFVAANKVLLNALLRANPSLLEKGLLAMVQVPQCRPFLDFDVKRQWFKTQVRRLRQHASRRHGSLRLSIRRKHVFEDAFHQLRLRNAEEMRGRLHITFKNEEGVDAGGLSREFFGILAKEMFNPNYALFTSTEDGCTFQPNPSSSINPDHLSYFRFVGRIVGKAVVDGFLLDAHFTRSLYKHMLGIKPTHHDMQAIDPDYYKNLKMILGYNLEDIGLDHLTFSIEDHSFGRSQTIDLIPNGKHIHVTEESKARYVSLICQHRMTTAIEKQIKAYLDGFYELVKPELISIFTAKELELLISGMPDIDMHDLQRNTEYQGFKSTDKEIGWFWNIMFSLTRSEKAAFLQFVTGSSKVPLEGFSQLQGMRGTQKFSIHKAGGTSGALVSAHTCFNALDLPVYKSEEEMREKIIYAINEGGGGFLFA
mmetsp:Transcript_9044/g.11092  ORF Transcript_9044/g.11092 Transcript_9044/m.11092 type:complete len:4662 (-) Transcript_9044:66-14051(-)